MYKILIINATFGWCDPEDQIFNKWIVRDYLQSKQQHKTRGLMGSLSRIALALAVDPPLGAVLDTLWC